MGFDAKDLVEVVRSEAAAYGAWFARSLQSPAYIAGQADKKASSSDTRGNFYVLLILSAFFGATVGSIIPGRPPLADRATVAVVVVFVWFGISVFLHGIVRLFGGKATIATTIRAMMQLLALGYVVSNVVGLVINAFARAAPAIKAGLADLKLTSPGDIIVACQLLFLLIYLPPTIRKVNAFAGMVAGCLIGLIGAVFASAIAGTLVAQGSC